MVIHKDKITNTPRIHRRTIVLSVRVSKHNLNWLKKNEYSISKIAHEAMRELGYKEE